MNEMSFWDHLEVFRHTLFRVLIVYVVVALVAMWAMPYIFSSFILRPAILVHATIININLPAQLTTHINTALVLALVATFPYIVYELWLFVRPALFPSELRHVRIAFAGGTVMFYLGCAVGYFILFPIVFHFLSSYTLSPDITNQINLQSYISTFSSLILIMGIVFEMPLVAWLLSQLGLLTKQTLRHYRRHAIVVLLILAAFITPTGDAFTLLLVAVPLYLLYEMSVLVVRSA